MLFPLPGTPTSQIPHSPLPSSGLCPPDAKHSPPHALPPNCVWFPVLTCPLGRVSSSPVLQEGGATSTHQV